MLLTNLQTITTTKLLSTPSLSKELIDFWILLAEDDKGNGINPFDLMLYIVLGAFFVRLLWKKAFSSFHVRVRDNWTMLQKGEYPAYISWLPSPLYGCAFEVLLLVHPEIKRIYLEKYAVSKDEAPNSPAWNQICWTAAQLIHVHT
jgi:hypothetical protein